MSDKSKSDSPVCWCVAGVLERRHEYEREYPCSPLHGTFVFFASEAERALHRDAHLELCLPPGWRLEDGTCCRTRHGPMRYPVWVQWSACASTSSHCT